MKPIETLYALEILDSRGRPTLKTTCALAGSPGRSASIPSGRSTGTAEAHELRDGDPTRYQGRGCLQAAAAVNGSIAARLRDRRIESQSELDQLLIELDGTADKHRLGPTPCYRFPSLSPGPGRLTGRFPSTAISPSCSAITPQPFPG